MPHIVKGASHQIFALMRHSLFYEGSFCLFCGFAFGIPTAVLRTAFAVSAFGILGRLGFIGYDLQFAAVVVRCPADPGLARVQVGVDDSGLDRCLDLFLGLAFLGRLGFRCLLGSFRSVGIDQIQLVLLDLPCDVLDGSLAEELAVATAQSVVTVGDAAGASGAFVVLFGDVFGIIEKYQEVVPLQVVLESIGVVLLVFFIIGPGLGLPVGPFGELQIDLVGHDVAHGLGGLIEVQLGRDLRFGPTAVFLDGRGDLGTVQDAGVLHGNTAGGIPIEQFAFVGEAHLVDVIDTVVFEDGRRADIHSLRMAHAPVNEDAKLGVFEPLHFGSSIFFNGNGPLLLAGGRNQTGGQNGRKY